MTFLLLILLASPSPSVDNSSLQSSARALKANVKGKIFPLRHIVSDRRLRYDRSGRVIGSQHAGRLTVNGYAQINDVEVKDSLLRIKATQAILYFRGANYESRFFRGSKLEIEIEIRDSPTAPPDLPAAFSKAFLTRREELPEGLPSYWKTFMECASTQKIADCIAANERVTPPSGVEKVGEKVSVPQVLSRVEPVYTDEARSARCQGTVVLEAIIGRDGHLEVIGIVRPLGFGLEENAIQALTRWTFSPGRREATPVDVSLHIEVNFSLR